MKETHNIFNNAPSKNGSRLEQIAVQLREHDYDVVDYNESRNIIRCSDFLCIINESYQVYQIAKRSPYMEPPPLETTLSLIEIDGHPHIISIPLQINIKTLDLHLKYMQDQISLIYKQRQTIPLGFTLVHNTVAVVKSNLTEIVDDNINPQVISKLKYKVFILRGKIGVGKHTMAVTNFKKQNIVPVCFQNESLPVPFLIDSLKNLEDHEGLGLVISEILGNQITDSISSGTFLDFIRILLIVAQKLPVVILTDQPNSSIIAIRSAPFSAITIDLFKEEIEEIYSQQITQRILDKPNIKYYTESGQIANPLLSIIKNS